MTELLRTFNEIFCPPVAYCVICLRTERDRRLVPLDSLELFIKSCNLPYITHYTDKLQRVCWVCARQAAAAHRFRLAVNLSHSLHGLFYTLRRPSFYRRTADMLSSGTQPKALQAAQWARQLEAVRATTTLRTTEVLLVSTPAPTPDLAPAPTEQYLLPDAPPVSPAGAPSPECVLVKQEEELTIEETRVQLPPPPPPPAPSLPAPASWSPQLVSCGDQMLLMQPVLLVPAGQGQGQGPGPGPGPARGVTLPVLRVNDMLSCTIDVEEEAPALARGGRRVAPRPAPPPAPPRKLAHTDWEDKIPMDIISYMDATDPLAAPPTPTPTRAPSPPPTDVIDLC